MSQNSEIIVTQKMTVNVRKLVNAVPVLNHLLVYQTGEGVPTSLVFSMIVAEIVEAVNPHVTAYNRAIAAYRKNLGLEGALREYQKKWRVEYGALVTKELTDEEKAVLLEEHDRINALLEKFDEEQQKLQEHSLEIEARKIPMTLLQAENIRLTGQQMHGLLWLLVADVPMAVHAAPARSEG